MLERRALPAPLSRERTSTRCCSPSGSCSWSIAAATWTSSAGAAADRSCRASCAGQITVLGRRPRRVPAVPDRRRRRCSRSALSLVIDAHALRRRSCAPSVDNQQAAAGPRHQRRPRLQPHLRARLGARRAGRRAGDRRARPRSDVPLKYMVYFLLVVAVGGAGTIKGLADRGADPGRVRRRRQVLRAAGRRRSSSTRDGRDAGAVPRGPSSAAARDDGDAGDRAAPAGSRCEIAFWLLPVVAYFVFPDLPLLGEPDPHRRPLRAVARPDPRLRAASSRSATRRSSASARTPRRCWRSTDGASRCRGWSRRGAVARRSGCS